MLNLLNSLNTLLNINEVIHQIKTDMDKEVFLPLQITAGPHPWTLEQES